MNFSIKKWQQYNWENNDLEDGKGLVESDIAHPDILSKFPGINLELEQPHHHQVVKIIKDSKDKCIYAAQHNASLDDLPHKTAGVSTAVNKVSTFEFPEDNPNLFHELGTPFILLVPPVMMMDDNAKNLVDNKDLPKLRPLSLDSPQLMVSVTQHQSHYPPPVFQQDI